MQNLKSILLNSRILLVLVLLALFAGCSDDEGSSTQPGTLDRLFSYPEITACGTCHYGNGTGPDLTRNNFKNSIVNIDGSSLSWSNVSGGGLSGRSLTGTTCDSFLPLVTRQNPDRSAILYTVSKKYNNKNCVGETSYGSHVYPIKAVLEGDVLKDFELWIENGAN